MPKKFLPHPAAEIFPIDEDAISTLADDIRQNGQHFPIELYEGKVIDGRRRLLACRQARIVPEFTDIKTDDPVAYVLSLNLHRRHLTPSQKSMVAARARGMYDEAAKERQKRKPADSVPENLPEQKRDARDAAGKALGVSGKSVDFASRVLKQGTPQLKQAVDAGRVSVSLAGKVAKAFPLETQQEIVAVAMTQEKPEAALREQLKVMRKKKKAQPQISNTAKRAVRTALAALIRTLKAVDLYDDFKPALDRIEESLTRR